MTELVTDQVFDGGIETVFQGIRQFARYPQYLPGVTSITVSQAVKLGSVCQVKYELKPDVRKAGGVYYTPEYIVDYIVKNTVGKQLQELPPAKIKKLKGGLPGRIRL